MRNDAAMLEERGLTEPVVETEDEEGEMAGRRAGAADWKIGRALRWAALVLLGLGLVPVVLAVLYWPSFVHPLSTLMLRDAALMQDYDRRWLPLDQISENLVNSVIMSEDGQFCFHHGIDIREMKGVVEDALAGEATRGASTIPMQEVKNLFLWQGRSFLRKMLEAPYAVYLDLVMPKRRIMEIYLNIVEWGPSVYGAEAAAQFHFGRSAKSLTSRQAALLAVTLPNPFERNPKKPDHDMRFLADRVQRLAARSGAYTQCVR